MIKNETKWRGWEGSVEKEREETNRILNSAPSILLKQTMTTYFGGSVFQKCNPSKFACFNLEVDLNGNI